MAQAYRDATAAIEALAEAWGDDLPRIDQHYRRPDWPAGRTLLVDGMSSTGVTGQRYENGEPVGPAAAFYAHTPNGEYAGWVPVPASLD